MGSGVAPGRQRDGAVLCRRADSSRPGRLPVAHHARRRRAGGVASPSRAGEAFVWRSCTTSSRRRWGGRTRTCTASRSATTATGCSSTSYPEDEIDEKQVTVLRAIGEHRSFAYEYDFGDSWEHEVIVEDFVRTPFGLKHAVCLDGQNACPPEDCGGAGGYAELLEVLANPEHEEHEHLARLGRRCVRLDPLRSCGRQRRASTRSLRDAAVHADLEPVTRRRRRTRRRGRRGGGDGAAR